MHYCSQGEGNWRYTAHVSGEGDWCSTVIRCFRGRGLVLYCYQAKAEGSGAGCCTKFTG